MKWRLLRVTSGFIALAVQLLPTQAKAHTTVEKCCMTYNGVEICTTCGHAHECQFVIINGVPAAYCVV